MTVGVYAGSFDPFTYGHLSIVENAANVFDKVIIAIGDNPKKKGLFSISEREDIILIYRLPKGTEVKWFRGLLTEYCSSLMGERNEKVSIIRGLRAISDFEAEMSIADVNRQLNSDIPTIFIPALNSHTFCSSSMVKELMMYPGAWKTAEKYIHPNVIDMMKVIKI